MGNNWNEGDLPAVPDFAEPVRLYRTFRAKINYGTYDPFRDFYNYTYARGFYSTSHEFAWGDGEVEAACLGFHPSNWVSHTAPKQECSCGFYGYHLPVQTTEFAEVSTFVAVIEGWGKIVTHALGARVQKARIVAVTTSARADDSDREWLTENYTDHRIDVDFASPNDMYDKYPPQDTTPFIGMTAIEAQTQYRDKQAADDKARQLEMLRETHKKLYTNSQYKACDCLGCKQFFQGNCLQPECKICSGELYINSDGKAVPKFYELKPWTSDLKFPLPNSWIDVNLNRTGNL
jgi:hypothetical protein